MNKQSLFFAKAQNKIGIVFSRSLIATNPLKHTGKKYPVYIRFLEFCQRKGWNVFVLTRKTYLGKGVFKGGWAFEKKRKNKLPRSKLTRYPANAGEFVSLSPSSVQQAGRYSASRNKFELTKEILKMDLIYDKTGGTKFPPPNEPDLRIVDSREFKVFCWDKWAVYQKIGEYMPQTFWVGNKENLAKVLLKIKTDWVVLKPYNGLKGIGIFIGPKEKASGFEFLKNYPKYIAQEFVDTSGGIPGIVNGLHDLRVVVINGKIVWSHVRTPPPGSFEANVARGGKIKEVACSKLPDSIKKITRRIAKTFYKEFDNPVFSLDFGMEEKGPLIFEINDQIGFPLWRMKARDTFLNELIKNFAQKLKKYNS